MVKSGLSRDFWDAVEVYSGVSVKETILASARQTRERHKAQEGSMSEALAFNKADVTMSHISHCCGRYVHQILL